MSRSTVAALLLSVVVAFSPSHARESVVVGANVNMVSGAAFPNGDPFQRQQNEPSVAFSSRNSLHLLSGANDYRAVDVPGLPGGRETGDSWLSYFWSTNGGATWKSNLIPGYPQDPACDDTPSEPTLCGYAAGADPVVRAGVNGMFYYSGIVFERTDPSRSAIFVSRFIDLNNDEGGDPIRYLDTVLLDSNDDGAVFLDKSWIGVDIPAPGAASKSLSVVQRNGATVQQTVACGNIYVGYAAIGGQAEDLRSEIRLATSTDCGDTWANQLISQPDSLNQGANIGIDPDNGDVHVVWRRFDTVETFLGIPASGCPADPSSWEVNEVWPVSSITVAGVTYTMEEAQELLGAKHKGDESIKVLYEVIAAKLNLFTGGGDPVPGFNPNVWGQQLADYIASAEAWLVDNPVGSDPKNPEKQVGMDIKKDIQEILLGSGACGSGSGGTSGGTTGQTNAILISSSTDGGQTFSAPVEIHESSTFDQGSTTFSFRTTAYPTVTVDSTGRVYAAWAARGFAPDLDPDNGDARIVVATSADGVNWTTPKAVDEPNRPGHQIKPSLLFAGGQLTLVYYDFRGDVSNIFESFVVDLPSPDRLRHTVDVRIATATPATTPEFTDYSLISGTNESTKPSAQASRYKFLTASTEYTFPAPNDQPDSTVQVEYMVPNYPMFADGTTPFIGDYVDVAAPNLIFEEGNGWRFATNPGDVNVWQAVWSDNRDVIPPPDGDWSKYVAPITQAQVSLFDPTVTLPSCQDVVFTDAPLQWQAGSLYTGTRNQNVYSASITQGLIVAAPGNNRPLVDASGSPLERGFVVYAQNSTAIERSFQLTISAPVGVSASFVQGQSVQSVQVTIPPYSSAAQTVFALSDTATPASETVRVDVTELGGTLAGSVALNSDPGAPDPLFLGGTSLLDAEIHNPAILNPAILNPAILNTSADPSLCTSDPALCVQNPAILNPAILNPAILNPAILNPAIFNPAIFNPAIFNPAILNPAILNPAIFNPAIFNPAILNPAILNPAILNPAIMNPAILNPAILNPAILNPAILNPAILNPAILNPAILNTTTADSGQVDVTFAVRNDGNATTAYDLNLAAPQLAGLDYEVLVYSLNETPTTDGCTLISEAQQHLIFRQEDPLNTQRDGSFYLEPGEEILVTFRVTPDVNAQPPADPVADFNVADLSGEVTSQPINSDGTPLPPADQFGPPITGVCVAEPTNLLTWLPGEGTPTDIVGNNDGTLFGGATFGGGLVNQAFLFDGVDDYMEIGQPLPESEGTVDFWVRRNGGLGADSSDVFFGSVGANEQRTPTLFVRSSGDLLWEFNNAGGTGGPLNIGEWYHLAMTWRPVGGSQEVQVWVNGVLVDTALAATVTDFQADVFVGAYNDQFTGGGLPPGQFANASIDEIDVFDRALSGAEIQAIYNAGSAGKCSSPPLVPLSTFDTDNGGWTIVNDNGGWISSGGNPGGYFEGQDSGGASSTAWYFSAPASFTGDQSPYYGGALRYDLQQSDPAVSPTSVLNDQPYVVLRGGGLVLAYDASSQGIGATRAPGTTWTPFTVPLDAIDPNWYLATDGCWTFDVTTPSACNFSGPAPSLSQFVDVLSNLDTLLIRGEYSSTLDVGGLDNAELASVTPPLIVSSITNPIRPGTGYVTLDFDPGSPLPADWQALGWQILSDDLTVFGPQNLWGQTATRITFRPFSTRLPAGADVAGTVFFADAANNPVSNEFPVTFSQTPGAPVIEAVYRLDNTPSFCGGGAFNSTLLSDLDPAPAGTWLAVDIAGVDTFPSGVPVFDGVDTPLACGVTTGGANANLRKYVQVPAGVSVGTYTLQWRAGSGPNVGPTSAARSFTN